MWHNDFKTKALANPVIHDAHEYGITIDPFQGLELGDEYWRIIGVHHLTGVENAGNHHLYLEGLDFDGNRTGKAFVGFNWEGMQLGEQPPPAILDKPANEPHGNIGLFNAKINAWMIGFNDSEVPRSDTVKGVHPEWADEEEGNTWGHHSFYVVWQQTIVGDSEPVPIPGERLIDHYVLLGDTNWAHYIIISRWLAEERVTAGFRIEEAKLARQVTMIGDFDLGVVLELEEAGVEVTALSGICRLADEIDLMLKSTRAAK
jgi:hypothetical protein